MTFKIWPMVDIFMELPISVRGGGGGTGLQTPPPQ